MGRRLKLIGESIPAGAQVRLRRRIERAPANAEHTLVQVELFQLKGGTAAAGLKAQEKDRVAVVPIPGRVDIIPPSRFRGPFQ